MTKRTISYLCFLASLFYACNSQTTSRNIATCNPVSIRLDIDKKVKTFPLSQIVDSIQYIKLETPNEHTIGEVNKILSFKNQYFISDYNNSLFCFDRNGKFKYRVARQGKGPGEYIKLTDFTIDSVKNQLILSDDLKLIFNALADGSFVFEYRSPSPSYKMEYIGNNQIFLDAAYNTNPTLTEDHTLHSFLISDGGVIKAKYYPYSEDIRSVVRFYNKMPQFFRYRNELLFSPLLINEVYALTEGQIHCKYTVDYGNYSIPRDVLNPNNILKFLAEKNEYALLCEAIETDAFIVFYTELQNSPIISVYDKEVGESTSFDYRNVDNDIDEVPLSPFTANDESNNLISIIYPHSIMQAAAESGSEKLNEFAAELEEFGNPIIAICFPKNLKSG